MAVLIAKEIDVPSNIRPAIDIIVEELNARIRSAIDVACIKPHSLMDLSIQNLNVLMLSKDLLNLLKRDVYKPTDRHQVIDALRQNEFETTLNMRFHVFSHFSKTKDKLEYKINSIINTHFS